MLCIDRDAKFVSRLPVWPVRKIKGGQRKREGAAKIRDFGGVSNFASLDQYE